MRVRSLFRFSSSLLLFLLYSSFVLCQSTPHDFHFDSSGQTTVPLSEQSIIEVTINGKGPYKLFFDTGAAVNVLNPEVIAQLGLTLGGDQADLWGVGGKVEAKPYRADEVRIGNLTLTGQTFYSIPIPLPNTGIVGAVGYELISRLIIKADNERHRITFYDPARFVYNGAGQKLELLPDGRGLGVHGSFGKIPADFVLDTGGTTNIGITINRWFAQRYHLPHRLFHYYYHGVFSGGAGGDAPAATLARIKSLCLGAACVPRIVGEYFDGGDKSQFAGTLGNEFLRRFTFTIDWQHRAIFIEKTSHWDKPVLYNQTGLLLSPDEIGIALVVLAVYPRSPASKAHIKVGDRILSIDNRPPNYNWYRDDPDFFQSAGTVVSLTVQHNNTTQQIKLKLKDIL